MGKMLFPGEKNEACYQNNRPACWQSKNSRTVLRRDFNFFQHYKRVMKAYWTLSIFPGPNPWSQSLECLSRAEPLSSSPRPQASPLGLCRCPRSSPQHSCLLRYRWEQAVKMNILKFILQESPCRWRNIILWAT